MRSALLIVLLAVVTATAQSPPSPQLDEETLRHFQALVRMDTSDPPGNEQPAAEYLKKVLEAEGIPVEVLALEPRRPNVVARLKGNGQKRPVLIMGHTDVVNVDPKKWTHPPYSATREGGYIYGRGTVDDKDNLVAGLMVMLTLKRQKVALDRDVIFLAEAGEEGSTRVGIQYMVGQHFPQIDAEYCFAEGGGVSRAGGQIKFASVQTLEKIPRAIELTARGISGHGSVPLKSNAVVHLAAAVAKVAAWKPQIRLNDTTRAYFKRLASISSSDEAKRYLDVIGADAALASAADDYFLDREPRHASMLRTSVSPTVIQAGYRLNVIPSEAKASLDVRTHPDEDLAAFLAAMKKVIDDPAVDVAWAARDVRPSSGSARLDSEGFTAIEANVTKHYRTVTLPTMSTGATDMAYLRAKGVQCFGVGPMTDVEDGPKGFGAHSDQERILESELYRFVRFHYDIVADLARARVADCPPTGPGLCLTGDRTRRNLTLLMSVQERRVRQKTLLRQEILDAARDILVREGYEGLSMRKVAERIDYSPTAIYLHFKDRDDLVFCVCEQLMAGLVKELQQVSERHVDPLVALEKGLRRYVEFGLKHPQHYQATFGIPHGHDPAKDARYQAPGTMGMQAFGFLPRLVGECVKRKKLAKVDPHKASCALWAGIHGITSLLIVMPNFQWGDRDEVIDQLITMLVDGLRA